MKKKTIVDLYNETEILNARMKMERMYKTAETHSHFIAVRKYLILLKPHISMNMYEHFYDEIYQYKKRAMDCISTIESGYYQEHFNHSFLKDDGTKQNTTRDTNQGGTVFRVPPPAFTRVRNWRR